MSAFRPVDAAAGSNVKEPCPECPFRKSSTPGSLGGSSVETFIGQAHGPFMLPCHMHGDFTPPEKHEAALDAPQCAGAAAYRAACPNSAVGLPRLPPRLVTEARDDVIGSPAEFYAHHTGADQETALNATTPGNIFVYVMDQMRRAHQGLKP